MATTTTSYAMLTTKRQTDRLTMVVKCYMHTREEAEEEHRDDQCKLNSYQLATSERPFNSPKTALFYRSYTTFITGLL